MDPMGFHWREYFSLGVTSPFYDWLGLTVVVYIVMRFTLPTILARHHPDDMTLLGEGDPYEIFIFCQCAQKEEYFYLKDMIVCCEFTKFSFIVVGINIAFSKAFLFVSSHL